MATNTFYQSDIVTRRKPAKLEAGPCAVISHVFFPVRSALVPGDVIEMLELPADHVVDDCYLDSDSLDGLTTNGLLGVDVGIMSGPVGKIDLTRTVGSEICAYTDTVGKSLNTAGFQRLINRNILQLTASPYDRSIGLKIRVAPGQPVVTGGIANGTATFSGNPTANDTLTLNGTVITFVASGATGNQVNIGGTLAVTLASLVTLINASTDTNISRFVASNSSTVLYLSAAPVYAGTAGNALTLAKSSTAITVSGSTLIVGVAVAGINFRGIWQPNTAYAVGDFVQVGNNLRAYVASGGAGYSGVTYPYKVDTAGFGGTPVQESSALGTGVTWTPMDPYLALRVAYRAAAWY